MSYKTATSQKVSWIVLTSITIVVGLVVSLAVRSVNAQEVLDIAKKTIAMGTTDRVTTRSRTSAQIMMITSSDPSVATARARGVDTVEIIPHSLGLATIEFWENAGQKLYRIPVSVVRAAIGFDGCQPFFSNMNVGGVRNGAASPRFTLTETAMLCVLETYHWNDGRGKVPGTIGLFNKSTGTRYGPFPAVASSGQGGADNVNWQVLLSPRISLEPGNYEIIDSDGRSWSWNAASMDMGRPAKAAGFAKVWLAE